MNKITIKDTIFCKATICSETDEVQVWIEVIITNQVVLCKNWFDGYTIANFDTSHITSDFYNLTREFMSQSNRCFLTRINMFFSWNEDWSIQIFMQVRTTDSRELDRYFYLMRLYFRYFHFFDTNIFRCMPASCFHCSHLIISLFSQFSVFFSGNFISQIVNVFLLFVKEKLD